MKATGIVRRIDDLGRVVVPKEIRRVLKIREGDPLEIFVDREGGVILKKYSPIGDLAEFATQYTESLQQTIGNIILISDRDNIISVSGASKKEYMEKKVSNEIEKVIESRKPISLGEGMDKIIPLIDDEKIDVNYSAQVISPIICEGDILGNVIIASTEPGKKFGEMELRLAQTASSFLGKQMES